MTIFNLFTRRGCGARTALKITACMALVAAVAACGDDDDGDGPSASFELVGEWAGDFGTESITETQWFKTFGTFTSTETVVLFDNDAKFVVTQNSPDASFAPGLYNRADYIKPSDNTFSYCTVTFGQPTADAARTSTQAADASDLDEGCFGFPWSTLTRQ